MDMKLFYLFLCIFFKKWNQEDLTYMKCSIVQIFSSYVNIAIFIYSIFLLNFLNLLSVISLFQCGLKPNCWYDNLPVFIFFFLLFSIPIDIYLILPFMKNFVINFSNLLCFLFFGKIKIE